MQKWNITNNPKQTFRHVYILRILDRSLMISYILKIAFLPCLQKDGCSVNFFRKNPLASYNPVTSSPLHSHFPETQFSFFSEQITASCLDFCKLRTNHFCQYFLLLVHQFSVDSFDSTSFEVHLGVFHYQGNNHAYVWHPSL